MITTIVTAALLVGVFALAAQLPWLVFACAAVCVAAGMMPERAR